MCVFTSSIEFSIENRVYMLKAAFYIIFCKFIKIN